MDEVLDLDEIARLFRVTPQAVHKWVASGLPVKVRGTRGGARRKTRISLRQAAEWYFDRNFERLELDRQRTRLAEEQADKLADEKALRRAELIRIADAEDWYHQHVGRARARLTCIADALGRCCAGEHAALVTEHARRLIGEAIAELAAGRPGPRSAPTEAAESEQS